MDWSTLIATITGAVIGVGATVLAERAQWRRSQDHHWMTVRREAYAGYLAALTDGSAALRRVVREHTSSAGDIGPQLHACLLPGGSWRLFHTVAMVGPADVVAKAEDAQIALQESRDALLECADLTHPPYVEARERLLAAMGLLRKAMRDDLRLPSLGTVASRPRW
ncbi:MAG TPA: hypothetical protein VH969_14035 [Actinophytocola sp.]|jgi:hypothetical protein|uniref:hypothetical protein n=1 Tax=Actinophytocola sp. TaxID=1872138 RepID=UPI002F93BFB1